MQRQKSTKRFPLGKVQLGLVFAISVAAGIFTSQIAQTGVQDLGKEKPQEIAQVGFVVEENVAANDARVLAEVRSEDMPAMQPIIASGTRQSELMAQKLNLRPSKSTLRRSTMQSESFEVAQHMSPTFGSPVEDPFLVDDEENLTNLIPGEDLLSDLILNATNKGISIEEVGIDAILNLANTKGQPLTIDAAIRGPRATQSSTPIEELILESDNAEIASRQTSKFVTPKRGEPTLAPVVVKRNTEARVEAIPHPADLSLPPKKSMTIPAPSPIATQPLKAPVVEKARAASKDLSTAVKAPIAPSVSSLRESVVPTPSSAPSLKLSAPTTTPKTESVFSINELLDEMEKPTAPQIAGSVTEVVEPAVEEKQDPSKYVGDPPSNEKPSASSTAETPPERVKSQQPIQYTIPPEPHVVITRQMASLRPKIAKTLRFYYDRPLNTKDDSAWSVMHSILGYGQNGMVASNGKKGKRTNAVSWMCSNNLCANRRLLYLDRGYIKGLEGPGFQGHPAQFLAMMAQVNLRRDYPLQVQGYTFQLEDMINSEMFTCSASAECTFKLIALSHYLHSDAKWRNEQGEIWSIPRLLEIELAQPVNGAACGGTHRVMSICYAVRTRERRGEPLDGIYVRAQKYMRDYQRYAMSLQNPDGSFSSDWYKRRSDWGDKNRQLQTTGHLLEWMVYTLPRNELSDPRIVKSVEFLTNLMTRHRYHDWEVGPRGHAIRALALYHQRVFERQPSSVPVARLGSLPSEINTLR